VAAVDGTAKRPTWQGILIPDPRVVATISAGDEYGTHVGPAIPGDANAGDLSLRTLRTERTDSTAYDTVTLTCTRPGAALTDGIRAEVSATVGAGDPMGWMDPVTLWGFARAGSTLVVEQHISRRGGLWDRWVLSSSLDAWAASEAHDLCPGAETNSVLYVDVLDGTDAYVIRSSLYLDGATTGPQTARQVILPNQIDPATVSIIRIRVALLDSMGLLLIHGRASSGAVQDRLYQWASDDGGLSWSFVGDTSDVTDEVPHGLGDVVAANGGFLVAYAVGDQTGAVTTLDQELQVARLSSPTLPVWAASSAQIDFATEVWDDTPDEHVGALHVAMDADEGGRVWLYTTTFSGTRQGMVRYSDDGGLTWESSGGPVDTGWVRYGSGATRLTKIDAVAVGGAMVLIGEYGSSAYLLRLGGWSSMGWTPYTLAGELMRSNGWLSPQAEHTYLGTGELPSVYGYSVGGTGTVTANNDHVSWTGTGGTRVAVTYDIAPSADAVAIHALRWTSAASAAATDHKAPVFVDVVIVGTGGYSIRIAIGSDEVRLYQRTGASTYSLIGSAVSHSYSTNYVDWIALVSLNGSTGAYDVTLCGRQHGSSIAIAAGDVLDDWATLIDSVGGTATDVLAHEGASRIGFGGWVTSTETGKMAFFSYAKSTTSALGLGQPDEIPGRPLTARMLAPTDVLIEAGGGVAREGDTWTIDTAADGSVEHLLDPDVGLAWESPGTGAATITLTWGDAQPGMVMGLLLRGVVAEGITVLGDGSVSLPIERSVGPMDATKAGGVITPRGATGVAMIRAAEGIEGGRIIIDDGPDAGVGQIVQARPGHWSTTAPTRLVVTGLPAAVGDGNVTATLLPADILLLWQKASDDYASITINLAAAVSTWPSGMRWKIQRALVGPVMILGSQWSWSVSTRTEAPVEDGRTSDTRLHPRSLRPPYRVVSVNWQEGIDESQAQNNGDGVTVGTGSNNAVSAWAGATAHTIEGILRELAGAEIDCVLIPEVSSTAGVSEDGTYTLNRRHQFIHGRITSSVLRDTSIGDGLGEVVRVGDLVVEEIT